MTKVYVLIKDETDYNGSRTVMGVYTSYDRAEAVGNWEREKAQDWCDSMKESDGRDYHWVPRINIEETEFFQGED